MKFFQLPGLFWFLITRVRLYHRSISGHNHDVLRLFQWNCIQRNDLLSNTLATGDILLSGLKYLESRFPQYLKNSRRCGTFCAIDCGTGARRDDVLAKLRSLGVHAGGWGEACWKNKLTTSLGWFIPGLGGVEVYTANHHQYFLGWWNQASHITFNKIKNDPL